MLLVFPSCGSLVGSTDDDVCFVRELDKDRFNARVAERLGTGWQVHEMTSKFRRTLFGGVTAYMAELRRACGGSHSGGKG